MTEPVSAALVLKSLDGLALRITVGNENIANASTKGYAPRVVTFEEALAKAALGGGSAVRQVKAQIMPGPHPEDGVRLDQELARQSMATARYTGLAEVLNRSLQIDALVVSGRR